MLDSVTTFVRYVLDSIASGVTKLVPAKCGLIVLPPIKDPIILLSAQQLAEKIKSGEIKCVDVVKAYKQRIEECDPLVNAVVETRYKEALEEAQTIDETIAKELATGEKNLSNLPLLGVPFAAKDCLQVKGMQLTAGFVPRKGCIQSEDAALISNLRKLGSIPLVMTNVPELAVWYDSANMLYGRTNNPYDLTRIPGGSSGGVAACVSYGGSPFGTGSDIAGSIRFPSHFCGLFGHLITQKAVNIDGHWPPFSTEQSECLSIGPICRYATDLTLLVKSFLGDQAEKIPKLDHPVDLSKLKIFYMEDNGGSSSTPVHPEIKEGIRKLMKCLSDDYHANVTKINIPHMDQAFDIFLNTMKDKPHIPHTQKIANFDGHKNPWLELVKKMVGASDHTLPVIIVSILETCLGDPKSESGRELIRRGEIIQEKLFSMLGDDGIFIYPAFPEPAINHYTSILKFQNIGYSSLFSLMGNPITTCPIGLSKNEHLPFGVQVMASPFNDHLTIAVARAIEEKLGGWKPPSRVELKSN
ncbi:fatty-acid amide hydrolase 2-A [Tetranychus urticae]|uniref:Amidase domain-containing protein n=1 Tax=Tetranychus urticae TaxID=32264 RepID=T1K5V3_TETUR|nr:fatty-acid amide hydrolase 2-A [Tetranychus urticae]